jgi:methionyl-tRNA synthetase
MTNKKPGAVPKTFLVTQALPYANGDIHLGHLVEAVQTDVYVRWQKLLGNKVAFVGADDTHGTAIQINAMKRGITPQQLISEMWSRHVRDYTGFNIGFDIFYTTDSPENRYYAELIYAGLKKKGLIEEKEISQYFCEHDGRFLPDRFIKGICPSCGAADQYGDVCEVCGSTYDPVDLKSPACITCGKTPVLKASRHLYVQLAKCEQFLRDYILSGDVLADEMKNFVRTWIDGGLKEWCISRDSPYFGFEIPDRPGKYFYVWLDAPIGYLSSTKKWCDGNGENVDTYWSKDSDTRLVHFIGKDIVYFHTLFWPVMLDSAGFKLPSKVFVHGFLTVAGEKMSKSRGTFVLASEFLDKVKHLQAAEYLRFYFAAKLSGTAGDIDLNAEELVSRINTILANNIGNFHHRTVVFCERYFNNEIPDAAWDEAIAETVAREGLAIAEAYEATDYKSVIERVQALGTLGNKYYQDLQPWELYKTDPAAAGSVMVTCLNLFRSLAVFLKPIVPDIVKKVEELFGATLNWQDHIFSLRKGKLGKVEKLVAPLEMEQLGVLLGNAAPAPGPAAEGKADEGIDISVFRALDLRVGIIRQAERIEKSQKLVKLQVECGDAGPRQIVAGIVQSYPAESLVGRQVVVIANLKSAMVMGNRSDGMLLAAKDGEGLSLVKPDRDTVAGSKVS